MDGKYGQTEKAKAERRRFMLRKDGQSEAVCV